MRLITIKYFNRLKALIIMYVSVGALYIFSGSATTQ